LHGCDNPPCCNAENLKHIHEGTNADNVKEMWERGRAIGPPVRTGSDANRSVLSDDQALEIYVRFHAGGVSQQSLAVEFNVSQPTISYIVRGKRRSIEGRIT
jgi:hypothetical protein